MGYPTAVPSFTTKQNGVSQIVDASHINDLQAEITALENALLTTGLAHDLKFPDGLYDIGKSGATRPRDIFLSRNATIGGTLGVTGATTMAALTATGNIDFAGFDLAVSDGRIIFASNSTNANGAWYFANSHASTPIGIELEYTGAAPNGTGNSFIRAHDNSTDRFVVRSNGGIANFSGNNVNLSDADAKDIVGEAPSVLESFRRLRFVSARYKDAPNSPLDVMVTAQNVEQIYPDLIADFDGWKGVREHGLLMRGLKAIQELAAKVERLEAA